MFNPVSKTIYYFTGHDEALKMTADWYDQVKFTKVVGDKGINGEMDYFGGFNLEFPSVSKVNDVWGLVIKASMGVQVGALLLAGVGFCVGGYKLFQRAAPAGATAIVLACVAIFAARAARGGRREAIVHKAGLNQNRIEARVTTLRAAVAEQGLEKILTPSDIKFFSDGEVDQILHRWIKSQDSRLLDELINPDNKIMQGLIQRLRITNPIKQTLARCQEQVQESLDEGKRSGEAFELKSFSERFYNAYYKFCNICERP